MGTFAVQEKNRAIFYLKSHLSLAFYVLHCLPEITVPGPSCVWLLATPWTVAHQAPLSMGFSQQEYWSGLLVPPPEGLPNPGIKPTSSCISRIGRWILYHSATWETPPCQCYHSTLSLLSCNDWSLPAAWSTWSVVFLRSSSSWLSKYLLCVPSPSPSICAEPLDHTTIVFYWYISKLWLMLLSPLPS